MNPFQVQIKKEIDDILQKRKHFSGIVKSQAERISNLKTIFNDLLEHLSVISEEILDSDVSIIKASLEKTRQNILDEEKEFEKLYRRFNRETINIGVIGQARQGKSTLLRRLSGLPEKVIPSRRGGFCTSAQSIIYHHEQSRTYAKVHFYSENSFINQVLVDYFNKLNYTLPSSIALFKKQSIPEFKPTNYVDPSTSEASWMRLKEYHEHVDSYSPFLKEKPLVMEVEEGDIEKFVSYQDNSDYRHLAVQKVEIFHKFPDEKTAVNSIGWIDMPGLGDTRLGDEERMIKALGEDTDFILLVRRPQVNDDLKSTDTLLSDAAHKALKNRLPLKEWSFMVLNFDGDNLEMCNHLKNHKSRSSLNVADFIIVNCDVADEIVGQQGVLNVSQLLEYVLRSLAQSIKSLDSQYMNSFKESFEKVQREVREGLKSAKNLFWKYDSHSQYVDYFNAFIKALADRMEELRTELLSSPLQPDDQFQKKIRGAIDECRKDLVKYQKDTDGSFIQEIKSYYNEKRSLGGTYDQFLHEIRSNALQNFHGLELGLKLSLSEKKERVSGILKDLGLDALVSSSSEDIGFLQELTSTIPTELDNLKRGFSFLSSFELQYKGFIQTIVWGHMRRFLPPGGDPSAVTAMLYSQTIQKLLSGLPAGMPIETIIDKLSKQDQTLLKQIPAGVESETLVSLLSNPAIQAVLQTLPHEIQSGAAIGYFVVQILQGVLGSAMHEVVEVRASWFDAEAVKSTLLARYEQAIGQCEKALEKLVPTPTEISISMIEEFIDHILSAKGVRQEWDKLLGNEENRLRVWPELKIIENKKQSIQDWHGLLDRADVVNQSLSNFV
jgi:hypothetical protein